MTAGAAASPAPAPEVRSGLEGVVAFATTIAEPDRDGGALRYRGIDIEDLVGTVPFEQVWGLLVDGTTVTGKVDGLDLGEDGTTTLSVAGKAGIDPDAITSVR